MTNIKHLFFDLDHTLWDFEKNSQLTFKRIFQEKNISVNFTEFIETYIPINLTYWKLFRNEKITKPNLRYSRLKDTFDKINYEISDNLINEIAVDYINYLPHFNNLLEGAIETLDYLKNSYELHIITNGFEEVQKLKIEKSGLSKYFNVVVTSECLGIKKPNPEIFQHALSKAKALPEESVMIGDSYEADIEGAINIGMNTIHLTDNKTDNNNISINSLSNLKQYL